MVKDAKIATIGEEANDIFIVKPINEEYYYSDKNVDAIKKNIKQNNWVKP